MMDLYALRARLGGVVSANGREWRGPGPGHSRQDNSLVVTLSDEGRALLHSFAGDPFRLCAQHVGLERASPMAQAELEERARQRRREQTRESDEAGAEAEQIWAGAVPLEGTQAESYLYSRGLILETEAVRYHPEAPRCRANAEAQRPPHPAMVALAVDIFGRPRAVHCTYLRSGRKAFAERSRLILGRPDGCAVRLAPIGPDGALAIGEGIETSASYQAHTGTPTWAGLSRNGIAGFMAPVGVRRLIAAADGDAPGLAAAERLLSRCRTSPRKLACEIDAAPGGQDWNDVLVGRAP